MKLRNKLALITTTAALAFVGTGFAAWAFTTPRTVDANITDKVAVGVELTEGYKLYNATNNAEIAALYLICDAPKEAAVASAAKVLPGAGIYWAYDEAGNNAVTDVYMKGKLTRAPEDGVRDITTVNVSFAAEKVHLASSYITFGDMAAIADTPVAVTPATVEADVQSAAFALPTLTYVADHLPHCVADLTVMNTALATDLAGAAIHCTAQIHSVA